MNAIAIARSVIQALMDAGVRHVVMSPGSRSGPLALAAFEAEQSGLISLHVRIDERTAAFLALGIAKSSGAPAAVITTSGTAAANVYPAMLEAKHSALDLVAVTADRPARLRGTGANQTTDQLNLFSGIDFFLVDSAVSDIAISGPLHVNVELDDPLYDKTETEPDWLSVPAVKPVVATQVSTVSIDSALRTVVIAGDSAGGQARAFAEQNRLPLLAEPSSNARAGANMIRSYRLLIEHFEIEQVVLFGHPTLSRPVNALLKNTPTVVVGKDFSGFPHQPDHARLVESIPSMVPDESDWLQTWLDADDQLSKKIDQFVDSIDELNPYAIARVMSRVPSNLFLGSSSPIRDLDLMASELNQTVFANRGLAGIDGTLSTALGASIGAQESFTCVVGDLTFIHDANAFVGFKKSWPGGVRYVVINDDGGSIFSILEQGSAEFRQSFERIFATPTAVNIGHLSEAMGVPYRKVRSLSELSTATAADVLETEVVEIAISREKRREYHEAINALAKDL